MDPWQDLHRRWKANQGPEQTNTDGDDDTDRGGPEPDFHQDSRLAGTRVFIAYQPFEGRPSKRFIKPLNVQQTLYADYLNAYCELRSDTRTFRLDRIVEVIDSQGEVHEGAEFFMQFAPPPPKGRSAGPSRHTSFGRSLKAVEAFGDMIRVLVFLAEFDRKLVKREVDAIMSYLTYQCRQIGLDLTKAEVTDLRRWIKMLRPDTLDFKAALSRVARHRKHTSDDVWELAEIVLGADGKISPMDKEAVLLLKSAIGEVFRAETG